MDHGRESTLRSPNRNLGHQIPPPAEVRHTELLRRASRPSESLSYPMFGDSGQTRDSPMLRPVLVIGAFRRDPVLILVQRAPQCRRFGIGGQNVA